MYGNILLLFSMLTTFIHPVHTSNIADVGCNMILLSDIETVLIHTHMDSIKDLLNHLLGEARIIMRRTKHGHVRNNVMPEQVVIEKLIGGANSH